MAKTLANVLVGVASLFVRQPNDSIAEWNTDYAHAGTHSVKLYKAGSGNAGSTHLELSGLTSRGITMSHIAADPTDFSFYYWLSGPTGNYVQFEVCSGLQEFVSWMTRNEYVGFRSEFVCFGFNLFPENDLKILDSLKLIY